MYTTHPLYLNIFLFAGLHAEEQVLDIKQLFELAKILADQRNQHQLRQRITHALNLTLTDERFYSSECDQVEHYKKLFRDESIDILQARVDSLLIKACTGDEFNNGETGNQEYFLACFGILARVDLFSFKTFKLLSDAAKNCDIDDWRSMYFSIIALQHYQLLSEKNITVLLTNDKLVSAVDFLYQSWLLKVSVTQNDFDDILQVKSTEKPTISTFFYSTGECKPQEKVTVDNKERLQKYLSCNSDYNADVEDNSEELDDNIIEEYNDMEQACETEQDISFTFN